MKTKEQMVQEAIQNLKNHNYPISAEKLERSIKNGTIELKPISSYTDQLIYAALIFAGMDMKEELDPIYTFETK